MFRGIIEQQENKLSYLTKKSMKALDVVTTTIKNLDEINGEIDTAINDISKYKMELESTETQLTETKDKNLKILNKFKNLIED